MTPGPDDVPDEGIGHIERGLEAYFAGDTARRLLEAIDWEALIEGTPVEEPIDYEQVGEVLGRLVARTIIKDLSPSGVLGQFIETTVGQEIGGRLGGAVVEAVLESGASEALADLGTDIPISDEEDFTTIEIEDELDDE
jgi:hypothetical protein